MKVTKMAKIAGLATFDVGTALDAYGVYNYYTKGENDPNAVHPGKAGINLGIGTLGIVGGIPGAILGVGYFGIDAFYPGGFPAAAEVQADIIRRDRQMLGYYPRD